MSALAAFTAALASSWAWPGSAHADSTVVVPGTAFPSGSTYLTYFGCVDLYHADTRGPQVRVQRDDAAPAGRRSTDLQMPGAGTASGPVSLVGSVAQASSSLSVRATSGASGVAWVWYVAPDLSPGQVWAGRADLQVGAGGWQVVQPDSAAYSWTRYEAASGVVVADGGSATLDDFTAAHGDGPGYLLAGFGCDAHGFALDRIQVGAPGAVTTYDLEGFPVSTTIGASALTIREGRKVVVSGATTDARGRVMGASLVLQQRPAGQSAFRTVQTVAAGPDGRPAVTLTPRRTTDYRWYLPESGYSDAGWSSVVRVRVVHSR